MTELIPDTQPDAGQKPLDPALLRAIRPSAARMSAAGESFVRLLHEDVRTLVLQLPGQGRPFCERTARTVLWLALSAQSTEQAVSALHWLGETNQADGFPRREYVSIGHALVRAVRDISGIHWTTKTGSAWIRFFMWLQPHLQAGAQQLLVPQPPVPQQAVHQEAADAREAAVAREAVSPDDSAAAPADGDDAHLPDGDPHLPDSEELPAGEHADPLSGEPADDEDEPGPTPVYDDIMRHMTARNSENQQAPDAPAEPVPPLPLAPSTASP
jgi:hypothetical protein